MATMGVAMLMPSTVSKDSELLRIGPTVNVTLNAAVTRPDAAAR